MADGSAIDAALVTRLSSDSTLMGYMPGGVWMDVAPSGLTRFVIVSLVISQDGQAMRRRPYEQALYLVKAVEKGTSGSNADLAAARIDLLLEDQALSITGYGHMATKRQERVRETEIDPVDMDTRWQHRGGRYDIWVSPQT